MRTPHHRPARPLLAGLLVAVLTALAAGGGGGGGGSAAGQEIATYRGPDRAQRLLDGSRAEGGRLLWYTTIIPDQLAQPLADAFEAKYPGTAVELFRGNSNEVAQRVVQEYRGNRFEVDLVDGTGSASLLRDTDMLQPYYSPELDAYDAALKDPDGYWGAELQYFMVAAYNTAAVPEADAPRTRADLLDPRWKGRMAWSTSPTSGAPLFIGNVLDTLGEQDGDAYLQRLAGQGVRNIDASGRAVLDQVVSGQVPLALNVFNDQVAYSAAKGAPVAWRPLDDAVAQLSRISLAARSPHPNTALLFLDFLFSTEGQQIISGGGGIPARPGVDAKDPSLKPDTGGFTANYLDPDKAYAATSEWTDRYERDFVR
jgi:ABC-type Fe3+ transport system substrate-binding protein